MCFSAVKSVDHRMARFLHHTPRRAPVHPRRTRDETGFQFYGRCVRTGAAIASSQTPPAAQAPTPHRHSRQLVRPAGRTARSGTANDNVPGILKGSATSGWTLSPVRSASGTAGATATAGGADAVTYSIVAADGSKVDLASMADKCVEVGGVLAPAAGGDAKAANRTFTVATIVSAKTASSLVRLFQAEWIERARAAHFEVRGPSRFFEARRQHDSPDPPRDGRCPRPVSSRPHARHPSQ
jgi:hypothetical protein